MQSSAQLKPEILPEPPAIRIPEFDRTGKRKPPGPIKVARQIQAELLSGILDHDDPDITLAQRAQAANAWEKLQDRIRVLQNKPKPRDAEVPAAKPKGKSLNRAPGSRPPISPPTPPAATPAAPQPPQAPIPVAPHDEPAQVPPNFPNP